MPPAEWKQCIFKSCVQTLLFLVIDSTRAIIYCVQGISMIKFYNW